MWRMLALLSLITACTNLTATGSGSDRQSQVETYCAAASHGNADGLWQCRHYYLSGPYAVPDINPGSISPVNRSSNAVNVDGFCSSAGSDLGIWQCKQYYERLYANAPVSSMPAPPVAAAPHPTPVRSVAAAPHATPVPSLAVTPNPPPVRRSNNDDAPGSRAPGIQHNGGIFFVPVLVNDSINLKFMIDSGASSVSIPADVVLTLMRMGTIESSDFLGTVRYTLADGSIVPSETFRLRSLRVGDRKVTNVVASVAPVSGPLLLGQSFLSRFQSWSIDNKQHTLILN
jgi:clan AA aspartic protease (TIGR02281 family)